MAGGVWACGMVRDEADIIGYTIRHLANEGVDGILIADNGSVDKTIHEIALAAADMHVKRPECQIVVVEDLEVGYYQSRKITKLANDAHDRGADWIIPFDADELWYSHTEIPLAHALLRLPRQVTLVHAELLNHYCTNLDNVDDNPFLRMIYRHRDPGALPKVAVRWSPDLVVEQGNHAATRSDLALGADFSVKLRHFAYRSPEQFIRKAKNGAEAYKATNLPEEIGAHWRQYGATLERHGEEALLDVYRHWFTFDLPAIAGLVLDPAPYCRWAW